jgi:hypothetical protein
LIFANFSIGANFVKSTQIHRRIIFFKQKDRQPDLVLVVTEKVSARYGPSRRKKGKYAYFPKKLHFEKNEKKIERPVLLSFFSNFFEIERQIYNSQNMLSR